MNEVRRVLRLASWRLWFVDVFRTLLITVTVARLWCCSRIVEQVLGLKNKFDPWWRTAFYSAGGGAVVRGRVVGVLPSPPLASCCGS